MSRNLALKADLDSPLILWSRNGENAKAHSLEVGNTVAMSSLTDVVQAASIIWSTLRTQEAVAAVYDEILQTDIQGKTFVECSTNGVQFCDELANKVVSKGAEFVAMPGKRIAISLTPFGLIPRKCLESQVWLLLGYSP